MNQVPLLTIKMVKPGVELVLNALNKLPREQVDGLYREIEAQANIQLELIKRAAEAAQASAPTEPSPDAEKAPSAPADPVPATANTGE